MTSQEKNDLIAYRIKKAKDTFSEVEYHVQNALWNTAINRLYYACFYAVGALLQTKDIATKTHAGAKQQLGLHFVLPGIISRELGSFYSELFDMRQSSDYEDFISYEKEDVLPLLVQAKEFIDTIEMNLPE